MTRHLFSASTLPVDRPPSRLLLFIQQAQLTLLYSECSSKSVLTATVRLGSSSNAPSNPASARQLHTPVRRRRLPNR
jgi:hypothetical protein